MYGSMYIETYVETYMDRARGSEAGRRCVLVCLCVFAVTVERLQRDKDAYLKRSVEALVQDVAGKWRAGVGVVVSALVRVLVVVPVQVLM